MNLISESLPDMKSKQIAAERHRPTESHLGVNVSSITSEQSWVLSRGFYYDTTKVSFLHSEVSLKTEMLHKGHLSMEKWKRRARAAVYWPGITLIGWLQAVRSVWSNKTYQTNHGRKLGLTCSTWMEKITCWWLIDYLSNVSRDRDVTVLCHVCYLSDQTHDVNLCKAWNSPDRLQWQWTKLQLQSSWALFDFQTCDLKYAQSNGKAEKGVDIVKQLLKNHASLHCRTYEAQRGETKKQTMTSHRRAWCHWQDTMTWWLMFWRKSVEDLTPSEEWKELAENTRDTDRQRRKIQPALISWTTDWADTIITCAEKIHT